jgi:hypothetical protein
MTTRHRIPLDGLPAATPTAFSATNAVLIGVFLQLLASGAKDAAEAWGRSHSVFLGYASRSSEPSGVTLVLTPISKADETLLTGKRKIIEAAIKLYAGYPPWSKASKVATLAFMLRSADRHPNSAKEQWWNELAPNVEASMRIRNGDDYDLPEQVPQPHRAGDFG